MSYFASMLNNLERSQHQATLHNCTKSWSFKIALTQFAVIARKEVAVSCLKHILAAQTGTPAADKIAGTAAESDLDDQMAKLQPHSKAIVRSSSHTRSKIDHVLVISVSVQNTT